MKKKVRRQRGAALVELAAVMMLGLPLAILFMFIGAETTHYFAIKSAMDTGARRAARELVIQYNNSGSRDNSVNFLNMPGYIVSANQFTVTWDANTPPSSVSVSCNYPAGGGAGLTPFPNGPLKYLTDACQFSLGKMSITSSCTMPVQ